MRISCKHILDFLAVIFFQFLFIVLMQLKTFYLFSFNLVDLMFNNDFIVIFVCVHSENSK